MNGTSSRDTVSSYCNGYVLFMDGTRYSIDLIGPSHAYMRQSTDGAKLLYELVLEYC